MFCPLGCKAKDTGVRVFFWLLLGGYRGDEVVNGRSEPWSDKQAYQPAVLHIVSN